MKNILMLVCLSYALAFAQASSDSAPVPTSDKGVARAPLLDLADVRVIRVELQPGATRSMHKHDDVRAHLFLPIAGSLEITIGSQKSAANPGQAFRMDKGTMHGFRNTGTTVGMAFEVFLKEKAATAANVRDDDALVRALVAGLTK